MLEVTVLIRLMILSLLNDTIYACWSVNDSKYRYFYQFSINDNKIRTVMGNLNLNRCSNTLNSFCFLFKK